MSEVSEVVIAPGDLSASLKARLAADHPVQPQGRAGRLYFPFGTNLYRVVLTPDTEGGFTLRCGVKPLSVDDALWEALGEPAADLHARVAGPIATCFLDQDSAPAKYPATGAGLAAASAQVGQLIADFGDVDTDLGFIDRAKSRYRTSFAAAQFDLGMMLELSARPRTPAPRSDFIEAQVAKAWADELGEFLGVTVRQRSNFVCFVVGDNFFEATISVAREIPNFSVRCSVKPFSIDDTLWELIGPYMNSDTMPTSLTWRVDGAFTVGALSTYRHPERMPPLRSGLARATDIVMSVVSEFSGAFDDERFMKIAAEKYPTTWELKSTQTLGLLLLYRTGRFAQLRSLIAERRQLHQNGAFSFSDEEGRSTSFFDVLSKAIASADLG